MKAENKQLNIYCSYKDAIIQYLKADTSEIIATSRDEYNNRIKAMTDLHRSDIVMTDRTIREQSKELQEQRKISNIMSFFFFNLDLY